MNRSRRLLSPPLCFLLACEPDEPVDSDVAVGIQEFLAKGYEHYADPRSITSRRFDVSKLSVMQVQETPSYDGTFCLWRKPLRILECLVGLDFARR